jgi:hypothetical protein
VHKDEAESQAWWHTPLVSTTQEAEVGGSLEPEFKTNLANITRLHLHKQKIMVYYKNIPKDLCVKGWCQVTDIVEVIGSWGL